jgi:hypothetical protein
MLVGKEGDVVPPTAPDGPFTLRSDELTLLELQPAPPGEHFRLEAEVWPNSKTDGQAGIFFAYVPYNSAQGLYHSFWRVGLAEEGPLAGNSRPFLLAVWGLEDAPPHALAGNAPGGAASDLALDPPPDPAQPWRRLVVEVTEDGVQTLCGKQRLQQVPVSKLREQSTISLMDIGEIQDPFTLGGGLGIYVQRGTACFREVKVTELP